MEKHFLNISVVCCGLRASRQEPTPRRQNHEVYYAFVVILRPPRNGLVAKKKRSFLDAPKYSLLTGGGIEPAIRLLVAGTCQVVLMRT